MQEEQKMRKKILKYTAFAAVPAVIALGAVVFGDRSYAFVSLCVALLACLPFALTFEHKRYDTRRLIIVAVMTALSAAGRFIFAALPGFKPVTAIIVITAVWFGPETGFMTGALSAVISNFYFGQGPWTPFQMLAWGLIGLVAGLICNLLRSRRIYLLSYGAAAGVAFSLIMDVWTVLWQSGGFNAGLYSAAIITALPSMAVYAISNVVFLFFLAGPLGRKFERMKIKYGI
jgi:energy-coupling factor transport system substrate-specific component